MIKTSNHFSLKKFFYIAIFIQLFRLAVLYFFLQKYDLYVDEVYYWGWSNVIEYGYYSKPPVIAWLIKLATMLFGESEIALKISSIIIYPITSSVLYLIAYRLFKDKKIAFYSAFAFLTLPAISLSSMIISTDVVLLLFWALSLYFFLKAIEDNHLIDWIFVGIFAGFGMLSKYNMIFFLVSVILVLILNKNYRVHFKNRFFYLALLISILIFIPNLYWQYSYDFISFVHTKEISQIDKALFHPKKFLEFFGAQFGVFGPLFFAMLLYLLYKIKSLFKDQKMQFLYLFVLPYFVFIHTLSILTRAFANWSAPIYVAATILVVAFLIKKEKVKLLLWAIGLNIAISLVAYLYHPVVNVLNVELGAKSDPAKRVYGWSKLAKEVQKVQKEHNLRLLFNDRTTMAEMIYYIKPHPFDSLMFSPRKSIKNQYELKNRLQSSHIGDSFLLIVKADLSPTYFSKYFEKVELLKSIEIPLYEDYSLDYRVYKVENFKGYL